MQRRFLAKDAVSWLVQAFLGRPALFDYAARRVAARPAVRATMGLVMGDLVPAGRALDPRFLAALSRRDEAGPSGPGSRPMPYRGRRPGGSCSVASRRGWRPARSGRCRAAASSSASRPGPRSSASSPRRPGYQGEIVALADVSRPAGHRPGSDGPGSTRSGSSTACGSPAGSCATRSTARPTRAAGSARGGAPAQSRRPGATSARPVPEQAARLRRGETPRRHREA